MATVNLDSPFISYRLSEQERIQGSLLTEAQKQVIHNEISETALEKLNLNFDPNNPTGYWQAQAELQGYINALQHLLTLSASAEAELSSPKQG